MGANGFRMPAGTGVGRVRLRVRDLERSLSFYCQLLGLRLIQREAGRARLSATGRAPELLVLEEDPAAVPKPPRSTGLYHFAILFPTRRDLARAFLRLTDRRWPFHGFSDHLVSEAIYLPDPDGIGVELCADRPRSAWRRHDGQLEMATRPLDLDDLVASLGGDRNPLAGGVPAGTVIGHIHLHVADLAAAEDFYAGTLGLEVTFRRYPGALFFAAGGYHHHLGTNIWAGVGAPRPPARAVGLLDFSLRLPDPTSLQTLAEHLRRRGHAVVRDGNAWQVTDADGHTVRLEAAGRPA